MDQDDHKNFLSHAKFDGIASLSVILGAIDRILACVFSQICVTEPNYSCLSSNKLTGLLTIHWASEPELELITV